MVCFAAIGASSLHLIIRTGHVSLCHSAFVGVGAYVSANVVMKLNLPFVGGLVAGTLAAAAARAADRPDHPAPHRQVFRADHLPARRDPAHGVRRLAVGDRWRQRTVRHPGARHRSSPTRSRSTCSRSAAAVFCIAVCGRILSSEIGRFVNAIRESEQLAECVGVPVIRTKILMFVIACAFRRLCRQPAGALRALHQPAELRADRVARISSS